MMRTGKTEKKIDAMTETAEIDIEAAYDQALSKTMQKHRETFSTMRNIMDGKQKPPRWCVTEEQKQRWKERTLTRLISDSGLVDSMGLFIAEAGEAAVGMIQRFGLEVYKTAYKGTMEKLRG